MAEAALAFISLHTADPGEGGAHELSGGGYMRLPARAGEAFSVPHGATVSHVGVWSGAEEGGRLLKVEALDPPERFERSWGTMTIMDLNPRAASDS